MDSYFAGKTILITGGTGSFGRAFSRKLIQEDQCQKVIIFSRDEWKQWEMRESNPLFNHPKMRYFLGDIRDANRLHRAFNEVDIVIHAAALKQVPAAEYNPSEFIKTNVIGGMNIIDAAIDCDVQQVIALSTDKAVNPVNLYGATKLCSDKLFVAANSYVGKKGTPTFSVVRYGNVSNSRGSIIPLWNRMLETTNLPLPITDERMTRFWITLDEAVHFVNQTLKIAKGGEIFVPKIPSFKINDLAQVMAKNRPLTVVGIREGEKLHELMISLDDARHTLEFDQFFIILPEFFFQSPNHLKNIGGNLSYKKLPDGFSYRSDNNPQWLDEMELSRQLKKLLGDEKLPFDL